MNGKDLLLALSFVDEAYVRESEGNRLPVQWKRWASMAACLCLILAAVWMWPGIGPESESTLDDVISQSGNVSPAPERSTEPPAEDSVDVYMEDAEVPAVIVRIDAVDGKGFTATVVKLVDTEIYPVGTELTVRLSPENELKESTVSWVPGDVVYLMFTTEDPEQGIVYADQIWIYDGEEGGSE